jgi:glycosyltransferase involved in cell wall biosynthesis/2-polyprenyl-3-methyl-5-hydroxy-6-metoxy-1,4-benzoquinol methylase
MTAATPVLHREESLVAPAQPRFAPMRLLFAANFPAGRESGIGNHLFSLAEALGRRGHSVDILLRDDFPAAAGAGRMSRLLFPALLAREVRRRQRFGIGYAAVNIHEPSASAYALARRYAWDLPPLVVTSHGVEQREWELNPDGRPRSLKTRIFYPPTELWQANAALRFADRIACLSSDDALFIAARFGVPPERIHRLSNGADSALLEIPRASSPRPALLFLGTWLRRKGAAELAAAFAALRAEFPWLRLRVAGSGVPADDVLRLFAPHVRAAVEVLPRVSRADLPQLLAADQIFVLPSRFEGMPLSLLEAMAAGLPCVTTPVCGMRHLLRDAENGALVPANDAAALASRLGELLRSQELRARLGSAARSTAREFTWDSVAAGWEAMFAEAARVPPRRYLLNDRCWSDRQSLTPQQRLARSLLELSEESLARGDSRDVMQPWKALGIGGRVLDLGCGAALKTAALNRHDSNFAVGCDFDAGLLGYARARVGESRLVRCDALALPFPAGEFDWVIAVEVIEHVREPARLLEEINRVLRPGGRLLLTTPNRLQYLRPWRPRWFALALRGRIVLEPSHAREFCDRELLALFPPGLRPVRLEYRGTIAGWPRRIAAEGVPRALRRIWAQGLECVAQKSADPVS